MADILSLSKARKTRAKAQKETTAAENRAKFGRSKSEKAAGTAKEELRAKILDAHARDKK